MKVLYVIYQSSLYGANRSLFHLILDLRERFGVEPTVITAEEGPFLDACKANSIPCFIVKKYYRWNGSYLGSAFERSVKGFIVGLVNKIRYPEILSQLNGYIPDLVHSNSSETDLGYYLSEKLGVPHIWHIREYGEADYNMHYVYRKSYVKKAYHHAAKIITISKALQEHYVDHLHLCPFQNTVMIYNGIQVPLPYTKSYFSDNVVNFCVCGLLSPQKRQMDALKAVKELLNHCTDFKLHLIGAGDLMETLKDYCISNHLTNNVVFWGYQDNVGDLLKKMDVGLMLSEKEAFGRVTVEYMLNYMPVIGSRSGGTPELVTNEVGLLYDPDDVCALTHCMNALLEHRARIRQMGERARIYAESHFSLKQNTDNIYQVYCDILRKGIVKHEDQSNDQCNA